LTLLVPSDDPIKLVRLCVHNATDHRRQLSATFYAEWVLGMTRDESASHVVTEVDPETGALLARNSFRNDFCECVAFADVNRRPVSMTADRNEFLGRHGSFAAPAALGRIHLTGRTGATLDPCAAIQTRIDLDPGETSVLVFLLGEAENLDEARVLIRRYQNPASTERALEHSTTEWDRILETVQVQTPDPALDLLLNRWLLYQVRSCRLWARSAFYQSGGAFGFRDQLQDVMSLLHAAPDEARDHILRAASRQFREGDVQHWWHPPAGRGVRTRISDDFLWLPYVTSLYVETTGDSSILDQRVPYLAGPLLDPGQEDDLGRPAVADEAGSLFEHCLRALDLGMRLGPHGLPLMGTGDWNDGMNRVGVGWKGESVWLAWFLIDCLGRFAEITRSRGDDSRSSRYREQASALRAAVEKNAWDGSWYLRAFFDDGSPLGSAKNTACQIDSIAQTWGLISGAADRDRSRQAMISVRDRLVRRSEGLVLLLDPPFKLSPPDPGYIKGYSPGIRENGAQYTHAATWVVQAMTLLGQGRLAHDLFTILNPIRHSQSSEQVNLYKVEPYVLAGDVYSQPPHTGRGGWTWYTGSAAWLYRVGLESILGIRRCGNFLTLNPCIPPEWERYEVAYRYHSTRYRIVVENPQNREQGVTSVWLDGEAIGDTRISLADDQEEHQVRVLIGDV
jgi:cyclic beta-1,2-glucan synthetase